MYAHKVIESYYKMLEFAGHTLDEVFNPPIDRMQTCPKYHFEDIESIKDLALKKDTLFSGEYGKDLRLPYKVCWFDYIKRDGQKAGALLTEIGNNTIHMEAYITLPEETRFGRDYFAPCPYDIFVGLDNETHGFVDNINNKVGKDYKVYLRKINNNVFLSWGKSDDGHPNEPSEYYDEIIQEIKNINACLLLLSCKNIKTEDVPPPEKVNKKRRKKGKPEILEFKTLKLELPQKQRKSKVGIGEPGSAGQQTTRLHLCSGHFKVYTQEAPLFGRHTGRFWWQPHVRGNKDAGEVNKEYVVGPSMDRLKDI